LIRGLESGSVLEILRRRRTWRSCSGGFGPLAEVAVAAAAAAVAMAGEPKRMRMITGAPPAACLLLGAGERRLFVKKVTRRPKNKSGQIFLVECANEINYFGGFLFALRIKMTARQQEPSEQTNCFICTSNFSLFIGVHTAFPDLTSLWHFNFYFLILDLAYTGWR